MLRGEGTGEGDTLVIATATRQQPVIRIGGRAGPIRVEGRAVEIADAVVSVGARTFSVADPRGLAVGDSVHVVRRGNASWISAIGMDRVDGRPGAPGSTRQWEPFDLEFDRVVVAIDGHAVTIDAPVTCAIERTWGGGQVIPYADPERVEHCGVENLRAVSKFDRSSTDVRDGVTLFIDEEHASAPAERTRFQDDRPGGGKARGVTWSPAACTRRSSPRGSSPRARQYRHPFSDPIMSSGRTHCWNCSAVT